jgi:hypothetical protein
VIDIDNLPLVPLIAGIAFLVLLVIVVAFLNVRGRRSKNVDTAAALGFSRLDEPDQALIDRLAHLQLIGDQRIELRRVHHLTRDGARVYLFDLYETGGDTSTLNENVIAITSPYLALPRFAILPRPQSEGWIASKIEDLLEKIVQWAVSRTDMEVIDISGHPGFDRRYYLLGNDEHRIRNFFISSRLSWLDDLRGDYVINASGDTFTIQISRFSPGEVHDDPLKVQFEEALRLHRLFQDDYTF